MAFYALEAAVFALTIAIYKYSDRLGTLSLRQGVLLLASTGIAIACLGHICRTYHNAGTAGRRRVVLAFAANLVAVALMLGAAESVVRIVSVPTDMGPSFAGTLLLPKRWELQVRRNAKLLHDAPTNISYFVRDTLLGWTVGPGRRSKNGLYLSSTEGIRSSVLGMSYRGGATRALAAVGDSFTFGLEGEFKDTWEYLLGTSLGTDTTILNFGVDGYGIDQAYLRYVRDVRPWHPRLALFGFIDHDLGRGMSVYSFITYPNWGIPFSKPRFTLKNEVLEPLNVPVIDPEDILSRETITELPFITYDAGYNPEEWTERVVHASYLARYVLSRFPRWPARSAEDWSKEEIALNSALLRSFGAIAERDGTVPIVIYFPTKGDFEGLDRSAKDAVLAAVSVSGIRTIDLTSCVSAIDWRRAFIPGHQHYSKAGNEAVARCLLPVVRQELERSK